MENIKEIIEEVEEAIRVAQSELDLIDAEILRRVAEGKRETFNIVLHVGEYDIEKIIERAVQSRVEHLIEYGVARKLDSMITAAVDKAIRASIESAITSAVEEEVDIFDFAGVVKERTSLRQKLTAVIAEVTTKGLDYELVKHDNYNKKSIRVILAEHLKVLFDKDLSAFRAEVKKEFKDRAATDLIKQVAAEIAGKV